MSAPRRRLHTEETRRIVPPSHRHAAPSAPWPWVDIDDKIDPAQLHSLHRPIPEPCSHDSCDQCWKGYPQSLYPNWTPGQVTKSKIAEAVEYRRYDGLPCVIYQVDVNNQGLFQVPFPEKIISNCNFLDESWKSLINLRVPEDNRIRALFIENMSGPIMQMLGTKYQEEIEQKLGDRITVSLTFVRSVPNRHAAGLTLAFPSPMSYENLDVKKNAKEIISERMIDTQAPLVLSSQDRLLVLDLLSVHLIRRKNGSVMISYHADKDLPTTTASFLHERIRFAGQSVYWQHIFQKCPDPTFLMLVFIWHAIYAWDEALENLYSHICFLESRVITTSEMPLTQELHVIRAHNLHHTLLLQDLRTSVNFVCNTANPALDALSADERALNSQILTRECAHLSREIDRLEMESKMQDQRLKNVMNLVFSSVNIVDSRRTQSMTEVALRDSAVMKQISYLTMVFLPASFVAGIFGMNVKEIVPQTPNGVPVYIAVAIPFTLATIWIITSFQSKFFFPPEHLNFWKKIFSPLLLLPRLFGRQPSQVREDMERGPGALSSSAYEYSAQN